LLAEFMLRPVELLMRLPVPFATEEPAPEPSVPSEEDIEEALNNLQDNLVDVNWWWNVVVPHAVRAVVIIIAAVIFRRVLVKAIDRLVKNKVHKKKVGVDGKSSPSATAVIDAKRAMQRSETLGSLFKNITTIIIYTFASLMVLSVLGFPVAPLLAGAGILGVALAFGAQSLVADFLSGVFIIMEDQYGVGDVADVGDATGTVEEVTLRITKIRSVDGVLWFVRNGEIVRVGNKSQNWSRTVLDVSVAYKTDLAQAKEVLAEVGSELYRDREHGHLLLDIPEVWGVEELAADGILIRLVVNTKPGEQWTASRLLLERIKYAFDENGIEIPFPQRTVWVRGEQDVPKVLQSQAEEHRPMDQSKKTPAGFSTDPEGFDHDGDGEPDGDDAGSDGDDDS
jgi:small-conductance mechanosensitive channel